MMPKYDSINKSLLNSMDFDKVTSFNIISYFHIDPAACGFKEEARGGPGSDEEKRDRDP